MSPVHIAIAVGCIVIMTVAAAAQALIWLKIVEKVNSTRSLEQQIIPRTTFLSPDEKIKQMRMIIAEGGWTVSSSCPNI
jgi:hypothetical protein